MDVHQFLCSLWSLQQRVAACGHLAKARADRDDQVALLDACGQFGVDADAHIASVKWVKIVKRVLKTKGIAHGQ